MRAVRWPAARRTANRAYVVPSTARCHFTTLPDEPVSTSPLPTIAHLETGPAAEPARDRLLELHGGLLALGHDSRVICREGSALHADLRAHALPHYALPVVGRHDLLAANRLGRWVRGAGAILHVHSASAWTLARWAARLTGTPQLVATLEPPGVRRPQAESALHHDHVLASHVEARAWIDAGAQPDRVHVVPRGIDPELCESLEPDWEWRGSLRLRPGELLVGGGSGAEDPIVEFVALVRGFATWRATSGSGRLVVFATEHDFAPARSVATELGLAADCLRIDPADVPLPRLAAVDIFVGSAGPAARCTRVLEAMSAARPVITWETDAAREWIEPDRNGMVIAAADPRALATTLGALHGSAARRQALGHAARERARDFDVLDTIEGTARVYQRAVVDAPS